VRETLELTMSKISARSRFTATIFAYNVLHITIVVNPGLVLVCSVYHQHILFKFFQIFPVYTFFCEKLNVVTILDGVRHDHESKIKIQNKTNQKMINFLRPSSFTSKYLL